MVHALDHDGRARGHHDQTDDLGPLLASLPFFDGDHSGDARVFPWWAPSLLAGLLPARAQRVPQRALAAALYAYDRLLCRWAQRQSARGGAYDQNDHEAPAGDLQDQLRRGLLRALLLRYEEDVERHREEVFWHGALRAPSPEAYEDAEARLQADEHDPEQKEHALAEAPEDFDYAPSSGYWEARKFIDKRRQRPRESATKVGT